MAWFSRTLRVANAKRGDAARRQRGHGSVERLNNHVFEQGQLVEWMKECSATIAMGFQERFGHGSQEEGAEFYTGTGVGYFVPEPLETEVDEEEIAEEIAEGTEVDEEEGMVREGTWYQEEDHDELEIMEGQNADEDKEDAEGRGEADEDEG